MRASAAWRPSGGTWVYSVEVGFCVVLKGAAAGVTPDPGGCIQMLGGRIGERSCTDLKDLLKDAVGR